MEEVAVKEAVETAAEVAQEVVPEVAKKQDPLMVALEIGAVVAAGYFGYRIYKKYKKRNHHKKVEPAVQDKEPETVETVDEPASEKSTKEPEKMN